MTEAQQLLFSRFTAYAKNIAFKWTSKNNLNFDFARYQQAALIGLWQACLNFDPESKVEFKSFSYLRILGSVRDEARTLDTKSRSARRFNEDYPETISIDLNSGDRATGQRSFHEIIPDGKRDVEESISDFDCVRHVLSKMPHKVRKAIELHFGPRALLQVEIAKIMLVSPARVTQLIRQGMTIARKELHIEVKKNRYRHLKSSTCRAKLSALRPQSVRCEDIPLSPSSKIQCCNFDTRANGETRLCARHA